MIERLPIKEVTAVPAANATVTLFDDFGDRQSATKRGRFVGMLRCDQGFTIKRYWSVSSTGALRFLSQTTYAGGVSGHVLGTKAQTVITAVTVANIAAGGGTNDYFSITVGSTTKTYEFKKDTDFVAIAGRTTIDVSELTTAAEVATAIYAAILADFPATVLTMAAPTSTTVTAIALLTGTQETVTAAEHVSNAGFTVANTAGTDGTVVEIQAHLGPGRCKIDCVIGSSAPSEFEFVAETSDEPYPT